MNRLACQYAIIRFLPYAETGEFANVGIVLACPETGYLNARLMPTKNTKRIAGFFDQLDKRIYREALRYLEEEVDRIRDMLLERTGFEGGAFIKQTFSGLTRPREALLRFSETRVVVATDADAMLEKLFARFVERDFANKQYHDQVLVRGVRDLLARANLRDFFKPAEIGNEDLHILLPFVHMRNGTPMLAIKPLDLDKNEPNQVFEHGGHWVDRVRRLRKHELLPAKLLFAIKGPDVLLEAKAHKAAEEIIGELREAGVTVATSTDSRAITEFAGGAAKH